jgi:hypothetical protein
MTYFTDEVARILAGPMPRRQALKLLSGVLAGAFLSSIGIQRAGATIGSGCNPPCGKLQICCSNVCIAVAFWQCCNGQACVRSATCCSVADSNGNYCVSSATQCSGSIIS